MRYADIFKMKNPCRECARYKCDDRSGKVLLCSEPKPIVSGYARKPK